MLKTKTFQSGRSQAVRIPKEYRFTEEEVYLNKIDGILMVVPKSRVWEVFDSALEKFTDDFMESRGDDIPDSREAL